MSCKKKDCYCKDGKDGKDGHRGHDGPQGPRGATGATGATGRPGEPGEPGEPGTPFEPTFAYSYATGEQIVSPGAEVVFTANGAAAGDIIPPDLPAPPAAGDLFKVNVAGSYAFDFQVRGVSFAPEIPANGTPGTPATPVPLVFDLTVNGTPKLETRFASPVGTTPGEDKVVIGSGIIDLPAGALVTLHNAGTQEVETTELPADAINASLRLVLLTPPPAPPPDPAPLASARTARR